MYGVMREEETVLDDIERGILYCLQTDARNVTNAEISDRLGVSPTTVGTRIEDLETAEIVKTYDAVIDFEKAGFPYRLVLFATAPTEIRSGLAEELLDVHGVIQVRELLSGTENLQIEVVGRTRDEVAESVTAVENTPVELDRSEIVKNQYSKPFDGFAPDQ